MMGNVWPEGALMVSDLPTKSPIRRHFDAAPLSGEHDSNAQATHSNPRRRLFGGVPWESRSSDHDPARTLGRHLPLEVGLRRELVSTRGEDLTRPHSTRCA